MDAVVNRIEALPGDGRFAVTFRRPDGSEQTAVAQVRDSAVDVAPASLPTGCTVGSPVFDAMATAVRAMHDARTLVAAPALRDVAGGWDVSLGNVVLGANGQPECIAHGAMESDGAGEYSCAECGARALY